MSSVKTRNTSRDVLSDAGVHIFIIMAVVQWHYRFCKDYTKGESKMTLTVIIMFISIILAGAHLYKVDALWYFVKDFLIMFAGIYVVGLFIMFVKYMKGKVK